MLAKSLRVIMSSPFDSVAVDRNADDGLDVDDDADDDGDDDDDDADDG